MMKRLFLGLMVTALSAMALAANTATLEFAFPEYAFVFTDTSTITWDLGAASGTGKAKYVSGIYEGSQGGLYACMNALSSTTVTPQTSAGSSTLSKTCMFGATSFTATGPFVVNWSTLQYEPDSSLVVVTNASNFEVTASITTAWTGGSGLTVKFATDAYKSTSPPGWYSGGLSSSDFQTIPDDPSSQTIVNTSSSTGLSFYTDYVNVYVVPMVWALEFDVFAQPVISSSSPATATVTFTGTALP